MADRIENALGLVSIHNEVARCRQRDLASLRSGGMRLHVAGNGLSDDYAQDVEYCDIRDLHETSPDAREA
jgi:hypothetical protein